MNKIAIFVLMALFAMTLVCSVKALPEDINGDGIVDMQDIALVATHFMSTAESPNWDAICDINADGIVDMMDIAMVAGKFFQ